MNTHQRWAQKMMRNEESAVVEYERKGADGERRRIRRAQMGAIHALRTKVRMPFQQDPESFEVFLGAVRDLEKSTRAPKKDRK